MQQKMLIASTLLVTISANLLGSEHPSKIKEYFGRPSAKEYAQYGANGIVYCTLGYIVSGLPSALREESMHSVYNHPYPCRVAVHAVRGSIRGGVIPGLGLGLLLAPFWVKKFAELKNNK